MGLKHWVIVAREVDVRVTVHSVCCICFYENGCKFLHPQEPRYQKNFKARYFLRVHIYLMNTVDVYIYRCDA